MLRDENGMLNGYVYVDVAGRDVGSYVDGGEGGGAREGEAARRLLARLERPVRGHGARARAAEVVLPLTLFLILMLLYMNTKSMAKTLIIVLAVPFSAVGAIWLLYLLGYNMSIGVWVGLIALMGVDAETGVFMLLYLDLAYDQAKAEGRLRSLADLQEAIMHGAVKRIRPKFMTVACMFMGLVPIMWSAGAGADVMKRIAAPMIGGIFTSFILELVVYPAIYEVWKWHFELKRMTVRMWGGLQSARDFSPASAAAFVILAATAIGQDLTFAARHAHLRKGGEGTSSDLGRRHPLDRDGKESKPLPNVEVRGPTAAGTGARGAFA